VGEVPGELRAAEVVELAVERDRCPQARRVALPMVKRGRHNEAVG
jgi:hypothetical protein